ncbi:hypothetical protein [uncultured Microbacterium sp.]|uniref:hypothetical protein n=1 Tax=uncultured Microbacterium sp. TaxID=191216 RepID=UPI0035C96C82
MPPRPRPLPRGFDDSFAVREARHAGVTERRLRHPSLYTPFQGVRVVSAAIAPLHARAENDQARDASPTAIAARYYRAAMMLHIRAYAQNARPAVFFSHVSAAVIWDVPLPLRVLSSAAADLIQRGAPLALSIEATAPLDVAVLAPLRAPRGAQVHGRQLTAAAHRVRTHDGLRVASPASMWAQMAPILTVDELIAIGDSLVNEPRLPGGRRAPAGSGLATLTELAAALHAGRRPHAAHLREALTHVRVGSASKAETDLRLHLVRRGLPEPSLDIDLFDAQGRFFGFTELAYPDYRLLIEHEGDHHRVDRGQWNRDIEKHALATAGGWTVLRTTATQLYPNPDALITRVREALVRAGWPGPSPSVSRRS